LSLKKDGSFRAVSIDTTPDVGGQAGAEKLAIAQMGKETITRVAGFGLEDREVSTTLECFKNTKHTGTRRGKLLPLGLAGGGRHDDVGGRSKSVEGRGTKGPFKGWRGRSVNWCWVKGGGSAKR